MNPILIGKDLYGNHFCEETDTKMSRVDSLDPDQRPSNVEETCDCKR